MRLAVGLREVTEEGFRFIAQLGVHYVKLDQWDILMSEPGGRGIIKADAGIKWNRAIVDLFMRLHDRGAVEDDEWTRSAALDQIEPIEVVTT